VKGDDGIGKGGREVRETRPTGESRPVGDGIRNDARLVRGYKVS
jgi:hypothetical protein